MRLEGKSALITGSARGIGMSLVPLLRRDGNILHVSHVDMLDGTPLLDIKPSSPDLDSGSLL